MAQTPTSETVYKTKTLSKWFAICSIALLVAIVWAVIEDFDRPWKKYARQAHRITAAQAEYKLRVAQAGVDPKKLQALEDEIKALHKRDRELQGEVEDMVKARGDAFYVANQNFQNAKAELDALQYQMEHAIGGLHRDQALRMRKDFEKRSRTVAALKTKADAAERARDDALAKRKDFLSEREKIQAQIDKVELEQGRLRKTIFENDTNLANLLRNAPLVDFVAPTLKIQQVVLPHLKDDYFFNKVPRVDRCMTCHATVDKAGFEDFPQPFKTHPKLDLMVGAGSKHPMEKIGCTTCHAGVPQSVDFSLAAHTPRNPAQHEEWKKKYNYYRSHHINTPMIPLAMTEGKCLQCHASQQQLDQAPTFNAGMRLIERYGCYTCHKFGGYLETLAKDKKPAPSLKKIASKVSPEWVQKWLWDPQSFRPSTLMPKFWKTHNNSDVESLGRSAVEIDSITHFIMSKAKPYEPLKLASNAKGDVAHGKQVFGEVGCLGCHAHADFPRKNPQDPKALGYRDPRLPNFGPELNQLGSKVSREWLVSWLREPKHYDEGTVMPSMKLTEQEAADVAEYLLEGRNIAFEAGKAPEADETLRDRMILDHLLKSQAPSEAETKLASMSLADKKMYLGERLVSHYGCYSCHAIEGFENAPWTGPELVTEGSKDVSKFAFENVQINHKSRPEWIFTKIRTPRIWDVGKKRAWDAKQKMPHFGFTEEQSTAIAAIVIGHENRNVDKEAVFPVNGRWEDIIAGQAITRQQNCIGCHAIEQKAGEVLAHYPDDATLGPPNLNTQGRKTQVDWLNAYLLNPDVMIRPWVKIRMPQFHMEEKRTLQLTRYFAALDGASYPWDLTKPGKLNASEVGQVEKLIEQLGCYTCHAHAKPGQDVSALAPHFENVARRLQPGWVPMWLHNPAKIMPGTRMPALWPSTNEEDPNAPRMAIPGFFEDNADRQMEAVRDYLFHYPAKGPSDYPSPPPAPAPKAEAKPAGAPTAQTGSNTPKS
jgi:cbb3-type cytochrome oxidase cytochrome c subunit